jgi:hypothetical protein
MKHKKKIWYPSSYFFSFFSDAGIWSSRTHMIYLEKNGKLTLPRKNGRRMLTMEMIEDIIKTFSEGKKEWHHDGN